MARKQSDYLADLLADDDLDRREPSPAPETADPARERPRGTTLLNRESALARVATGEVRQVTQLLLNPARVRIWPGNARSYAHLSEESCRELIDAIIAEGGQKVPAVVRRVEGEAAFDYEVIAGTRRHWAISWLRANSYPDMQFVAQVYALDDEAAFRLADIENRARKDVSDFERARNYAAALGAHYGNRANRMAERLRVSKGWLSKMLKVAAIPDAIVSAFATPADLQLKPGYTLAQALDDKAAASAMVRAAAAIAKEQSLRRAKMQPAIPAQDVLKRLLAAGAGEGLGKGEPTYAAISALGRPMLTVQSANRQGVTVRLHAGSGAEVEDLVDALRDALASLEGQGRGLQR
jgi:ParB family chromosome partitioning protein